MQPITQCTQHPVFLHASNSYRYLPFKHERDWKGVTRIGSELRWAMQALQTPYLPASLLSSPHYRVSTSSRLYSPSLSSQHVSVVVSSGAAISWTAWAIRQKRDDCRHAPKIMCDMNFFHEFHAMSMNPALLNGDWPAMSGLSEILSEIQSNYPPTRDNRQPDEDTETSSPVTSESASVSTTAFPFSEADLANYAMLPGSLPRPPFHFTSDNISGVPLTYADFPFCDAEREVYDELTGPTDNSIYSRKVFIGGLPKTLTAKELCHFFSEFGPVMIDWPHRERMPDRPPHGYAFAVFSRASSVDALVNRCSVSRGKHCIYLGPYCVQVRPWVKMDREHYMSGYDEVNSARTQRYSIFIGGVARTTTARNLAETIDNAIGDVVAVRIEVDYDTEYPKGAARVIFATEKAYVTAIARRFIQMASHDLHKDEYKEVEMKPYLEDCMICERCFKMSTRSFCAELRCLKYFCDMCWKVWHSGTTVPDHRPMLKGLHQQPRYSSSSSATAESYRSRTSAPPSPFATGGAHSPPSSAGPFGAAGLSAFYGSAAAAAAMAAATARASAGGSLRGLGTSPYGGYPSLLTTPSALLYANQTLADASSMGRRGGMAAAANLRLADLHRTYNGSERAMIDQLVAEMGVRPPSAFGGSSSSSSLAGGISGAPPTPGTGGFTSASASSSATTQFTFDDLNSFSPPAESPHSPRADKSKQSHNYFGF